MTSEIRAAAGGRVHRRVRPRDKNTDAVDRGRGVVADHRCCLDGRLRTGGGGAAMGRTKSEARRRGRRPTSYASSLNLLGAEALRTTCQQVRGIPWQAVLAYRANPGSKREFGGRQASSIRFSINVVAACGPVRFADANCRRYVKSQTHLIAILSTTTRPWSR